VDETWNLEPDDSFGELELDIPATRDHSAFLPLASALSALYAKEKEGKDLLGDVLLAIPKQGLTVAAAPILDCILTDHAVRELRRRGLDKQDLDDVLKNPGQRLEVRRGRVVLQSKTQEGGTEYLLRIFVDIDRNPAEIVTAYRTSKVSKYWREQP
jgi:Domain of unknown function (DUF4258)